MAMGTQSHNLRTDCSLRSGRLHNQVQRPLEVAGAGFSGPKSICQTVNLSLRLCYNACTVPSCHVSPNNLTSSPCFAQSSTFPRGYSFNSFFPPSDNHRSCSSYSYKDVWNSSVVDTATHCGLFCGKEVTNPYSFHRFPNPYLVNKLLALAFFLFACYFLLPAMPTLLRKLYKSAVGNHAKLVTRGGEPVPYEASIFGALEYPARDITIIWVFLAMTMMLSPPTISPLIAAGWTAAAIYAHVWFLHSWKRNFIPHELAAAQSLAVGQKLLIMDSLTSVGLFFVGLLIIGKVCGVINAAAAGIANGFYAKRIVGDKSLINTLKEGMVDGQVVETGKEEDSYLVNVTIGVQSDDMKDKIPMISDKIKTMLRAHDSVFKEKMVPRCFPTRVESSYAELVVACHLKHMSKDERCTTQRDIFLEYVDIIKKHDTEISSAVGKIRACSGFTIEDWNAFALLQ